MPRSSFADEIKRMFACAFYRWEFIRRSNLYASDFAAFFNEFGDWLGNRGFDLSNVSRADLAYWIDFERKLVNDSESKQFYLQHITPYLQAFRLKWGISCPQDPTHTLEDPDLKHILKNGFPTMLPLDETADLSIPIKELARTSIESARRHFEKDRIGTRDLSQTYEMNIYISERMGIPGKYEVFSLNQTEWKEIKNVFTGLESIYEKSTVNNLLNLSPEARELAFRTIHSFIGFLDLHRQIILWPIIPDLGKRAHVDEFNRILKTVEFSEARSGADLFNQRLPNSKIQIKKLPEYISVWDLRRAEPDLSNLQIAKRLFGKEYGKWADPEALTRRVQRAQDRAQAYIDGDFRQIR